MQLFNFIPMTIVPVMLAVTEPATAQTWQEYTYLDDSFSISFPADPLIETAIYRITDERAVKARIYVVRREEAEFKVTVADLADPAPAETAVIDHAIRMLSAGGEVKVNIPHRVNRVFGRQLSILQGDGGHSAIALFNYNGRLYQIEGKSLPTGNNATADAIRFVQSIVFTGGGSNRSPDDIRAARGACNSGSSGGASPGIVASDASTPADSARFELRCRRQQAFAALATAVNSGDLPSAQRAFSSLSDIRGGGQGWFAQVVSQIGQALQTGDLSGARQALSSLPRGRSVIREP
jgi:hypothetical protein